MLSAEGSGNSELETRNAKGTRDFLEQISVLNYHLDSSEKIIRLQIWGHNEIPHHPATIHRNLFD